LVADDYRNQVYQLDAELRRVSAVKLSPFDRPIGVDYDFDDDRIYWTDFESSVVKRAFLNGSDLDVIKPAELGTHADGPARRASCRAVHVSECSV